MENIKISVPTDNDDVVLISNSRLVTVSCVMVFFGAFGMLIGIYTLLNHQQFEIPALIFAILAILGSSYALWFAVKCFLVTRVQSRFEKDGLSYRDVRKHVTGRNITGIGLGFYINTKFYFLPYANIEKVSLKKVSIGCNLICIDTKLNEVIYLPILLDSCKEVDELANLIEEKRQ
ncbi:hypothetical protein EZJ43_13390 [Pedobacter changchengzhani]|uniref:Uncharacterized protein n=1 Tax=Pedobacter changchengzhani TaxID=2529274 RepID=A0A4R5MJ94_9SPHI|nr:hypothetical protein [Pedobacter changchengzhani]TDG35608.1 hypothetical protein EZJ43_13390 [Pedobacter changchengzhani]